MQEIFTQIETAWPAIRDFLLGHGLVIGITIASAFLLTLVLRWVTAGLAKSKVKKKIDDPETYRERRNLIIYAARVVLRTIIWAVAAVIILVTFKNILTQPVVGKTESGAAITLGDWLAGPGLTAGLFIVGAAILSWLVNFFTHNVVEIKAAEATAEEEEKAQRKQTILHSLRVLVTVVIWVLGGLMALTGLGINITAILAGLGVVGVAVGFGAQSLIKDILGGIFIVLEDHMRLGDVVHIGDVVGTVEKITLRITVLRDIEGHYITIPNGEIKVVENLTPDWSRAIVKVGVGYGSNIDTVVKALHSAADDLRTDEALGPYIMDDPIIKAIDNFGDSALDVAMWIKCNPGQQWEIGRIARRYIKTRFDEAGIEIPFPQITLTVGKGEAELLAALKSKTKPVNQKKRARK
ncbi:mechanosensitive ion channel [candidate division WOR-3 bacterium]|uniref:Mechanosensitive ion channel n=1 Tax=candidate division WOR-3 bacterium TaxID=2052148 RepID=A0A9D5QEP1_UNCW3|nr:mechanosensitive ion channel [candidate division WOR-3 bacterium]MBD3365220.1 mechanosensitive ion channel [candidate division WOR-3 bacterium]